MLTSALVVVRGQHRDEVAVVAPPLPVNTAVALLSVECALRIVGPIEVFELRVEHIGETG